MEKGTSRLLPNPKVPFASEFVFNIVSEFWKSYFQCYSKSSLPLCNIHREALIICRLLENVSNQVIATSNSLASLNYSWLINHDFSECFWIFQPNHPISKVTYRWSKPKCTKHVTPNNKCYQWRIPVAADIEPREMEGKTEELENMANICFNLPKKTDKCFKFTDTKKEVWNFFTEKTIWSHLANKTAKEFP